MKLPKKAEAEVRHLRRYASYIPCGCYGRDGDEDCDGQPNCARADFKRIYRRLRDALRTTETQTTTGGKP